MLRTISVTGLRFVFIFAVAMLFVSTTSVNQSDAWDWGNCEDKIFSSGSEVGYYCTETEDEGSTDDFCTFFEQTEGSLSFIWNIDEETLDCQCRHTFFGGFETSKYEFICTGIEEDEEVTGLIGKIFWRNGPIIAEGVDVDIDGGDGEAFILTCKRDRSCDPR